MSEGWKVDHNDQGELVGRTSTIAARQSWPRCKRATTESCRGKADGLPVHGVCEGLLDGGVVLEAPVRVEEEAIGNHEVDVDGNAADLVREAGCEVIVELLDRFRPERGPGKDGEGDESRKERNETSSGRRVLSDHAAVVDGLPPRVQEVEITKRNIAFAPGDRITEYVVEIPDGAYLVAATYLGPDYGSARSVLDDMMRTMQIGLP